MVRILVILAAAASLPSTLVAAAVHRVPIDTVVASLVRDLGADPYDVRERATATLRKVGDPARAILEKAAESDDPEIRVRARELLGDVRSGIRPHWPAHTVLLMRHFDRQQEHERYQALQQIVAAIGHEAVPFLLQRMAEGNDNEAQWALRFLQQMKDDRAWREVLQLLPNPANDVQARALAWARGQSGQAIEAIEQLARDQIKKVERDPAVEKGIQDILASLQAGKAKEAVSAADALAKKAPNDARILYLKAEALVVLDQDKDAVALRTRALELNPETEAPHFLAAELLGRLGRRRLAAREWERIVAIMPNDGVYDINAWLSLSAIYAASGLFEQAAQYLDKAQQRYAKLKADDKDAVIGGTVESLQMEASRLRQQAARFPTPGAAAVVDPIPDGELAIEVSIQVKDAETKDLGKALARVATQIHVAVEPPALSLFEDTSAELRYDKGRKQLIVMLGDEPACEPFPYEAKDKEFQVAAHAGDRTRLFTVNAESGKAEPGESFDKDYTLKLKAGVKLGTFNDVALRINGKAYPWSKAAEDGLAFDRLPDRLDIIMEGTAPSGGRLTARFDRPAPEPDLKP